jgi:malonyl CoA-acyl carrier protein transacylase
MQKCITELLNELKILKARIEKETNSAIFVTAVKGNKAPANFQSKELFEIKAKSQLKSIQDLIEYRNKIKAVIVISNANTKIIIAGKEYTVAGAIERKNSIEFEKRLVEKLSYQFKQHSTVVQNTLAQEEQRLDKQLETILGKDKADVKAVEALTEAFWKENQPFLVDPCSAMELAEKMNNDIAEFESAIDVALAISNAREMIEV